MRLMAVMASRTDAPSIDVRKNEKFPTNRR